MQISSVQHGQQLQKLQPQTATTEGSPAEEANESASEKAAEALKQANAQSTGVGVNLDTKV